MGCGIFYAIVIYRALFLRFRRRDAPQCEGPARRSPRGAFG